MTAHLLALALATLPAEGRGAAAAAWDACAEAYLELRYRFHPTEATRDGLHERDAELEDRSRQGVAREIAALEAVERRAAALDGTALDRDRRLDRALVLGEVRSRLLDLRELRSWRRDPDAYQSGLAEAAFHLMQRAYAPAEERLRALVSRERAMPAALAAGRANLERPPRVYVEIALRVNTHLVRFFERDVPLAFAGVGDAALRADFEAANAAVVRALRDYAAWLEHDLLPRARGRFALGADRFRRKLLYDEGISTPLPELRRMALADLRRNQRRFAEVAARVAPGQPAAAALARLQRDHPPPDGVLPAYTELLGRLRRFVVDRDLMSIPRDEQPILRETPPFMRATTLASLMSPGPFERVATDSYFNATLPDAGASASEAEDLLQAHARPIMLSVAVHEAWPGHFMQHLWESRFPTRVRQVLGVGASVEGWAHYAEEMMLDEGVAGDEPLARLGQLAEALLRDVRFVVALGLHTGGMTLPQAVELFVEQAHQPRAVAELEVRRGTRDPMYLRYTLGKLQILKLRDDYRRARGERFTLRDFHDRFMALGYVPLDEARRALLEGAPPAPVPAGSPGTPAAPSGPAARPVRGNGGASPRRARRRHGPTRRCANRAR